MGKHGQHSIKVESHQSPRNTHYVSVPETEHDPRYPMENKPGCGGTTIILLVVAASGLVATFFELFRRIA